MRNSCLESQEKVMERKKSRGRWGEVEKRWRSEGALFTKSSNPKKKKKNYVPRYRPLSEKSF